MTEYIETQSMGYQSVLPVLVSIGAADLQGKGRKSITKVLSTGHEIHASPQEDKMLRRVYDYMAGYSKRSKIEKMVDQTKLRFESVSNSLPSHIKEALDNDNTPASSNIACDDPNLKSSIEIFSSLKVNISNLEKKLSTLNRRDEMKISTLDVDEILRKLGVSLNKKQLEQMIWEVDENIDSCIDWDEFQLCYYRNIQTESKYEARSFFRLIEFLIFDEMNKGYIIEDDCMESLFARLGSTQLEMELSCIFGKNLRANGGTGMLDLQGYFLAMENRDGQRALIG